MAKNNHPILISILEEDENADALEGDLQSRCPARSIVDGWLCCKREGHTLPHETAGGYKFTASR